MKQQQSSYGQSGHRHLCYSFKPKTLGLTKSSQGWPELVSQVWPEFDTLYRTKDTDTEADEGNFATKYKPGLTKSILTYDDEAILLTKKEMLFDRCNTYLWLQCHSCNSNLPTPTQFWQKVFNAQIHKLHNILVSLLNHTNAIFTQKVNWKTFMLAKKEVLCCAITESCYLWVFCLTIMK